jgi:hypothetical protein
MHTGTWLLALFTASFVRSLGSPSNPLARRLNMGCFSTGTFRFDTDSRSLVQSLQAGPATQDNRPEMDIWHLLCANNSLRIRYSMYSRFISTFSHSSAALSSNSSTVSSLTARINHSTVSTLTFLSFLICPYNSGTLTLSQSNCCPLHVLFISITQLWVEMKPFQNSCNKSHQ